MGLDVGQFSFHKLRKKGFGVEIRAGMLSYLKDCARTLYKEALISDDGW